MAEPVKPGFFTRAKNAVTGFVSSALKAAPVTAMYSAASLAISAGMAATVGWDPLSVAGSDMGQIGARMLGVMTIGSTISGVMGAYEGFTAPCECPTTSNNAPQKAKPKSQSKSLAHSQHLSINDVSAPSTPVMGQATRTVN